MRVEPHGCRGPQYGRGRRDGGEAADVYSGGRESGAVGREAARMRTGLETVAALVWWQCGLVQSAEKIKNQRGPPAHTFRSVISSFLLPRPPFSPCEDEVLCLRFVLPTKVARGTFFSGQLCAAKDHVVDSRQDPSREAQGAHPPVALAPVARARVLHTLAVVHCTRSLRSFRI